MAKRKPAQEDDFGFIAEEDMEFTPEEQVAAGEKMGSSMLSKPKSKSKEKDFGFIPSPDSEQEPDSMSMDYFVETAKDIATTAPQGLTTWADEIQAAAQAGGKKLLGAEEPYGDIYEQDVAEIRQGVSEARARSPYATAAGELGVGIGSAFIPGIGALTGAGKFGTGVGMIGRGTIEGLGTAEDKASLEGLTQAGIGGAIGAGGALVSGGLKKLTTESGPEIRANILGARTSEFKEIGIKERGKIADDLNKMGLFQSNKVDFDVNKSKFVSKGKSLENLEKPTREKLVDRLDTATGKIQKEKEKILGKHINDPIDLEEVEDALDQVVKSYRGKATGMPERMARAEELKQTIVNDILEDLEEEGLENVTIGLLEKSKMRLSEDVGNYGKNPLLQKTPDDAQLYQSMYSSINKKLRKLIGNNKYAEYNEMQQKMLTAKTDLAKAVASEKAQTAQAGWGGWFNKLANETLGSPEAGLGMANVADILQSKPVKPLLTPVRAATEEAPFSAIRYLDPSTRNPYSTGRSPDSIGFSPKDVINFKIPRNTQAIMENKDIVLAKLVQKGADPMVIDAVAEGLNGSGDDIANVMPLLVTQMPTLFEKAKYSTFDGKFLDPNDRAKAADDISKRDDMNSIQRAKMINKINKSGEVPEGL
jgi:hypothetical protein